MYNGVEYAERRTLISSHRRATGSRFISGTVENVYNTSHMQETTAGKQTIFFFFLLWVCFSGNCIQYIFSLHNNMQKQRHKLRSWEGNEATIYWYTGQRFTVLTFTRT